MYAYEIIKKLKEFCKKVMQNFSDYEIQSSYIINKLITKEENIVMDIMTFIRNTIVILETIFFILTVCYLVKGLKIKNYQKLKKYGIIYLILNFIRKILVYAQKKSVTVSIIGGADGPTSIFLAGKVGTGFFWGTYLVWLLVTLLGVGILIYIRRKK